MSVMEALLVRHPGEPTVGIWFIKRMTGHARKGDASLVRYVEGLIAKHGSPPPLPLFRNGGTIQTDISADSRWLRAAVMEWLEGFLPPSTTAALSQDQQQDAAEALDAAAARLVPRVAPVANAREAA